MMYLAQQWADGSVLRLISLIVGGLLILPSIILTLKNKGNIGVYVGFGLPIIGGLVMVILGVVNKEPNLFISGAVIEFLATAFLLLFVFKWSKE